MGPISGHFEISRSPVESSTEDAAKPDLHVSGDPGHEPDAAAAGALPPVLDGAGGGVRLPRHHRPQPPLPQAEHPPHARLGPQHPHTAHARHPLHEGAQAGWLVQTLVSTYSTSKGIARLGTFIMKLDII